MNQICHRVPDRDFCAENYSSGRNTNSSGQYNISSGGITISSGRIIYCPDDIKKNLHKALSLTGRRRKQSWIKGRKGGCSKFWKYILVVDEC